MKKSALLLLLGLLGVLSPRAMAKAAVRPREDTNYYYYTPTTNGNAGLSGSDPNNPIYNLEQMQQRFPNALYYNPDSPFYDGSKLPSGFQADQKDWSEDQNLNEVDKEVMRQLYDYWGVVPRYGPYCSTPGVTCDSGNQRIIGLNFSSYGLQGMIPTTLTNLQQLRVLDLSDNLLVGTLNQALDNIDTLTYLDLSNNGFFGTIPQLFNNDKLSNLVYLDLSNNYLAGAFPFINFNQLLTLKMLGTNKLCPYPDYSSIQNNDYVYQPYCQVCNQNSCLFGGQCSVQVKNNNNNNNNDNNNVIGNGNDNGSDNNNNGNTRKRDSNDNNDSNNDSSNNSNNSNDNLLVLYYDKDNYNYDAFQFQCDCNNAQFNGPYCEGDLNNPNRMYWLLYQDHMGPGGDNEADDDSGNSASLPAASLFSLFSALLFSLAFFFLA